MTLTSSEPVPAIDPAKVVLLTKFPSVSVLGPRLIEVLESPEMFPTVMLFPFRTSAPFVDSSTVLRFPRAVAEPASTVLSKIVVIPRRCCFRRG